MAGSPEEYERLCLNALRKASEGNTDFGYHHERASIFATLALAAATEEGGRTVLPPGPTVGDESGEPRLQAS